MGKKVVKKDNLSKAKVLNSGSEVKGNTAPYGLKGDSWSNTLAGIGGMSDKTSRTKVGISPILTEGELTDIWTGEGVGSRIVSVIPEDATREWISIPQDTEEVLSTKLQSLDAQSKFQEALTWSRLYGGAVILMGYSDNGKVGKPLRKSAAPDINYLKVYELPRVRYEINSLISDPKSEFFEDHEYWSLQNSDGTEFTVHRSRLLFFKGVPTPKKYAIGDEKTRFWGMSSLQQIYDELKNFGAASQGVANLLLEFNIGVFKIDGLADLLAQNNVEAIKNRIEIINASKGIINSVLIGENEAFSRDVAGLGGLADILKLEMTKIAGVSGIASTKLFGDSPSGMNSTGESDSRNYFAKVESFQENKMRNPLQVLINAINKSLMVVDSLIVPFEFLPVWSPSQAELIKMRKEQADTDKIYVDMGAITVEEVREQRFENGYSFEMGVQDEDAIDSLKPKEEE